MRQIFRSSKKIYFQNGKVKVIGKCKYKLSSMVSTTRPAKGIKVDYWC